MFKNRAGFVAVIHGGPRPKGHRQSFEILVFAENAWEVTGVSIVIRET